METIQAIMTRRSIRSYEQRPVERDRIEILLRAAMQAPSGHDRQPWHFVVITERALLSAITEFHPYAKMLRKAPSAILVCGDTGIEESVEYINTDCSAATQNLLLAAHAMGIGAVWLGIYPRTERVEGMRGLLGLPSRIVPVALVALGYPEEQKEATDRYRSERVRANRWKETDE